MFETFRSASALKFRKISVPKQKNFPSIFFDFARPPIFQKRKRKFLFWIFVKQKGGSGAIKESVFAPTHPCAHA